jgi:formylglycine-generating enzyme required for sulfatase activity
MKMRLVTLGWLMLLAGSAQAWRPAGWVYASWPYAYEQGTRDWYWFSPQHVHWAYGFPPADGWKRMNETGLAQGWSRHARPYAYCWGNTSWYFLAADGRQWCVNLRTGVWSIFGLPQAPSGMTVIFGGTNAGTDPDFGAYSLTARTFFMDTHEVTKALWDEVYAWAIAHGYAFDHPGGGKAANHPVHSVNWYDCAKWCNARSEKEGRPPAYYTSASHVPANVYRTGTLDVEDAWVRMDGGYRLPTDAEWMYAARGGVVGRRFTWSGGDTIDRSLANYYSYWLDGVPVFSYDLATTWGHHPTYKVGSEPYTSPVGSFPANGFGLYDMVGNVYEWVFDRVIVYPDLLQRMARGSSWRTDAGGCRIGVANRNPPNVVYHSWGFRTALSPAR